MVFRLKGAEPFESEVYHVFTVLNYDPTTYEVLYLVNGTSQLSKRYADLERQPGVDPAITTVAIVKGAYSFFSKDTLIDCNTVHEFNLGAVDFSDDTVELIFDELSSDDTSKIVAAVKASPLVEPYIKSKL